MKKKTGFIIFIHLIFLCQISLFAQNKSPSENRIDSLKVALQGAEGTPSRVDILNDLTNSLLLYNYDLSEHYNNEALKLSSEANYQKGLATALYYKALLAFNLGEYDTTYVYCQQALKVSESIDEKSLSAIIMNRMGYTYQILGSHEKALSSYLGAMKRFEEISDHQGVASVCNRLGIFYESQQEYKKSFTYYQKALDHYKNNNDIRQQAVVLNNIGIIYHNRQLLDEALKYYKQSRNLLLTAGDITNLPIRDINIGKIYKEKALFKEADTYFHNALSSSLEAGNKKLQLYSLKQLGESKILEKKPDSALFFLNRALKIALKIGEKNITANIYKDLADIYYSINNYKKAHDINVQYHHIKDSLFNIERSHDIAEIETKYRISQKEKEITLLKNESEKKDIILYAFISGLFLFSILILLIIINYQRKSNASRIINEKNEELNRQKISDLLKEQQLKSVHGRLEGQENERRRIAKELHDGIGGTLASIKLSLSRMQDDRLNPHLSQVVHDIDELCEEVRSVSHNLAPPAFFNSALTDIIQDFLAKSLERHQISVHQEFYPEKFLNNIPTELQVDLYRIIQELITNITKHAEASQVEIIMTAHDNLINLMVEDNGKGFDPRNTKGIGLQNISSRVKALQGTIHLDAKPGRGTAVSIDIPYVEARKALEKNNIELV